MTGLLIRKLGYSYGARQALCQVDIDVARGQFCALLGPNGAGKSTLFSLLTRLVVPASGTIEIVGHDLARAPRKAMSQIGVVFQQPTLDLDLSVAQNLTYFAALHGLAGRTAQRRIEAALDRLAMRPRASEKVRALNGGHRRRTEIARCLLHRPSVLLLDEPTVGLDAASRRAITNHVHELSCNDGLTVLWATHLSDEVRDDDHLVILHEGQVLKEGRAGALRGSDPLDDYFLSKTAAPSCRPI